MNKRTNKLEKGICLIGNLFKNYKKSSSGITLIALVITIIILLILAGITIGMLTGENGILTKAKLAARRTEEAKVLEEMNIYESGHDDTCVSKSQFDYVIGGSLKEYIENKIGRTINATDIFYKIDMEKLGNNKDEIYITNEDKSEVIKISTEELAELKKEKAVWFWCNMNWESENIYVDNPEKTKEVLDELQRLDYNTIYIPIDQNVDAHRYENFIKEAYKRDMYVYDLQGDPAFIFEDVIEESIYKTIDKIANYNASVGDDAKIRGVHYDVEPYGNSGYDDADKNWVNGQSETAKNSKVRKLYVDFVKKSAEYAKQNNILSEYDVSFTFNRFTFYDENGEEKNVAEEIVKYADQVTLMIYTTNENYIFESLDKMNNPYTETDGSILQSEKSWMQIANENNKNYQIGVELDVFKGEAENLKQHPEYAGVYIDPNYEYSITYIEYMLSEVSKKIDAYDAENNIKSEYSYCVHDIYKLLKLSGYLSE